MDAEPTGQTKETQIDGMHNFICNICGSPCASESLDREIPSCSSCGSNARFRWIVNALSAGLFGESLILKDFPRRKQLRGLGMSDPLPIAEILAKKFDYRNTCYHREPRFDIMEAAGEAEYDFIIASEVFEHVRPPVQRAFDNLARLLKPGGFAVFSTPWESDGDTVEHFPGLHDWQLVHLNSGYVLLNRNPDGKLETFEDLNFHGGPGSILEMRVFSESGLIANCRAAGFGDVEFGDDNPNYGIVWEPWSRGMLLRKSMYTEDRRES
ncbi:MAG TPA: methyltransferase domain-containing protein [Bryobacteraceae bacterium]|nr:methyltransferase domain-containing protein [Bryobacteraceae bacterium]